MFGIEIENLNLALMLLAAAAIISMAAPPLSALAKDDTAKQLVLVKNHQPIEEKQASR